MNEYRSVLERAGSNFPPLELEHDSIVRRRDRKRRNQRITAGVVGLAVFLAVAVVLGTAGLSDRTQGPAGGAETGPTTTGPANPSDAPCAAWSQIPLGCWFDGLPPEEAVPDTHEGEVVAQWVAPEGFVYMYADRRVLVDATWERPGTILARRITPEGLEHVRSGETKVERLVGLLQLPTLWEGDGRVYVASRYAICYTDGAGHSLDPSDIWERLLPSEAEALLHGKERTYDHAAGPAGGDIPPATCFEVTLDEARTLDGILSSGTNPAFERVEGGRSELSFVPKWDGQPLAITFNALLPHGEWVARYER